MRIRISDGTHEVEIEEAGKAAPPLADLEAAAGRLLVQLRQSDAGEPVPRAPFGFDNTLDGASLDSSTERAEPYDDGRDYEDDE
ncbi:hypothetical protein [Streptomyces rimosus]|uniref:hypothetical protein n=1 Tax=Streptomyces rimosus TaxID=1927 RepID=UPI0004C940D8|nr:hypothetical protein [Streptomyces rimosus]